MVNKIRLIVGAIVFSLLFTMCNSKLDSIEGLYVGENFTHNIDSIYIMPNRSYKRIVYDNKGKLIFKNKSTYKKYDSYIEFNDFLLNINDLKVRDNYTYTSEDLTNASLNLENNFLGKIKLVVDYDLDYYYIKQ